MNLASTLNKVCGWICLMSILWCGETTSNHETWFLNEALSTGMVWEITGIGAADSVTRWSLVNCNQFVVFCIWVPQFYTPNRLLWQTETKDEPSKSKSDTLTQMTQSGLDLMYKKRLGIKHRYVWAIETEVLIIRTTGADTQEAKPKATHGKIIIRINRDEQSLLKQGGTGTRKTSYMWLTYFRGNIAGQAKNK